MAQELAWRDGHGDPRAPGYRGYRPYDEVMTMVERGPFPPRFLAFLEGVQAAARVPYRGITTDGHLVHGLWRLQPTGISTSPIKDAADAFLATLDDFYRPRAVFALDAPQWRLWDNIGLRFNRHGMWFLQMTDAQRTAAIELLRVALSNEGFELVEKIFRFNDYLERTTMHHHFEGGRGLYRLSIFGDPSLTEPWGFQVDGHHININYVVVGDQIVMSPRFFGAEPTILDEGPDKGLALFQTEQELGLNLMRSLSQEQQAAARVVDSILTADFPPERHQGIDQHHLGGQGRDNSVIPFEGLRCDVLSPVQLELLDAIVEEYMKPMPPGHRELRVEEIRRYYDKTWFTWMGGFDDVAPFYYRIQSPVVILEFDHQSGASYDYPEPNRFQIHTLVRTPNGNDYGKALIRAHRLRAGTFRGRGAPMPARRDGNGTGAPFSPQSGEFLAPRQLRAGPGCSATIGSALVGWGVTPGHAVVVADRVVAEAGLLQPALAGLTEAGFEPFVYDAISGEPDERMIDAAAAFAREHDPVVIIGAGGGSALDSAKLVGLLATNPGEAAALRGVVNPARAVLPLVLMPTTTGTGSETTRIAMFSVAETKQIVSCVQFVPVAAVLDPLLVADLPPSVVAATGMDALAHSVESMLSLTRSPLTVMAASDAASVIVERIEAAVRADGEQARGELLFAAYLAGLSLNAGVLLGHSLGYVIARRAHVPHGVSTALALPYCIAYNESVAPEVAGPIVRAVLGGDGELADVAVAVAELARRLGLPTSLEAVGIAAGDLDEMAAETVTEYPRPNNPVPLEERAVRRLLECMYAGDVEAALNSRPVTDAR